MGSGVGFFCPQCGYMKEIDYGGGFMSCPGNPMIKEQILEGKFGARAKKAMEENPDAGFYWYMPLFHCKCGNVSSKSSVLIWNDGGDIYRPGMRCGVCHKSMWEIEELPRIIPCPKCGTPMEGNQYINWD